MILNIILRAFALVTLLVAHGQVPLAGQAQRVPVRSDQNRPALLVLAIDDLTRPWIQLIGEGIRSAVADAEPAVTVYQEFLDSARFDDEGYTEGFRDWLRRKYAGRRIDLVVVPGQEAVEFLSRAHGEPWPKVPVMYGEVGQLTVDISKTLPGATGVIFEDTLRPAVRVIKTILPNARQVAVVYGVSPLERYQGRVAATETAPAQQSRQHYAAVRHSRGLGDGWKAVAMPRRYRARFPEPVDTSTCHLVFRCIVRPLAGPRREMSPAPTRFVDGGVRLGVSIATISTAAPTATAIWPPTCGRWNWSMSRCHA